jgi:hypothetical protein
MSHAVMLRRPARALLVFAVLTSACGVNAAPLQEANVTKIINDVQVFEPAAGPARRC